MTNKTLEVLYIEITNHCNYGCRHCGNDEKPNTLEYKTIERVLDDFKRGGGKKLVITGGEPLLHPRIEDILAKAQDYETKLSTNGLLLNNPRYQFALGYNHDFKLSLDGPREVHNKIRGSEHAYDYTIKAMKKITETGREMVVRTTVMRSNLEHIGEMIWELDRLTREEGIKMHSLKLWPIRNIGKANKNEAITPKLYKAFLRILDYNTKSLEPTFRIIVGPTFGMEKEFKSGSIETDDLYKCNILSKSLEITPTGDVYPCSFLHHSLGNIKQEGIQEIFTSEKTERFREEFFQRKKEACGPCKSYEECKGGCVAETYGKQNKDIYCFR
ncbi:MAG: radical SAM protein [archaeon]